MIAQAKPKSLRHLPLTVLAPNEPMPTDRSGKVKAIQTIGSKREACLQNQAIKLKENAVFYSTAFAEKAQFRNIFILSLYALCIHCGFFLCRF